MTNETRNHLREEDIVPYLESRLAGADRARVDEHLADCGECRNHLAELRSVMGVLDEWVAAEPLPSFDAAVRQNLAIALRQIGDPSAKSHFEIAISLDPDAPGRATSYHQLGKLHRQDGRLDLAEECFRNAIRLDERNSDAHNSLAVVLALRGNSDEGLAHFQRALEIDPDDPRAHLNLAKLLMRLGRPSEAEPHFARARRAHTGSRRSPGIRKSIPSERTYPGSG